MTRQSDIIEDFARNVRIIKRQAAGLSHADSLIQPPVRANCMNWVLGHIVYTRIDMMQHLGAAQFKPARTLVRYASDTELVLEAAPDVVSLEQLLADLDCNQHDIAVYVNGLSDEALAKEVKLGERVMSREQLLRFFLFHDTYHTGNLDLLRQLAGANDKVL
jgi:uncharacterized damage-inducible protein DinB